MGRFRPSARVFGALPAQRSGCTEPTHPVGWEEAGKVNWERGAQGWVRSSLLLSSPCSGRGVCGEASGGESHRVWPQLSCHSCVQWAGLHRVFRDDVPSCSPTTLSPEPGELLRNWQTEAPKVLREPPALPRSDKSLWQGQAQTPGFTPGDRARHPWTLVGQHKWMKPTKPTKPGVLRQGVDNPPPGGHRYLFSHPRSLLFVVLPTPNKKGR